MKIGLSARWRPTCPTLAAGRPTKICTSLTWGCLRPKFSWFSDFPEAGFWAEQIRCSMLLNSAVEIWIHMWKSWISVSFMNFHKFSRHESNLNLIQSFHHEFSGSSRVENMIQHDHSWGWTKGKAKRLTELRAHTKNVKFSYQKNPPRFPPYYRRWVRNIA